MSVTKSAVESIYRAGRTAFAGANVVIRHGGREYTGTRLPKDNGRTVDDAGEMMTISGGVRLLVSELAPVRPKEGDTIQVKSGETAQWLSYTVGPIRYDEMEATMLLQYGELYDESGA